jgi:hypothetical protein
MFRLRKRYIILLPIILLIFVAVSMWAILDGFDYFYILIFLIYGFLLFLIIYKAYIFPVKAFKRNPRAKYEYSYSFNKDGVELVTVDASSKYQWNFFKKVVDTKDMFLFFYNENAFITIPKRAFNSDSEIDNLKCMITDANISIKRI